MVVAVEGAAASVASGAPSATRVASVAPAAAAFVEPSVADSVTSQQDSQNDIHFPPPLSLPVMSGSGLEVERIRLHFHLQPVAAAAAVDCYSTHTW